MKLEPQGLKELPTKMARVDQAIAVIEYLLRKKQKRIDQYSAQVEISENQKIFIGEETDLIKNVNILIRQAKNKINELMGKLPPQATELETQILGACMLHTRPIESAIIGKPPIPPPAQIVRKFLKPDHFYLESNKIVYSSIISLEEPTCIAVVDDLRKRGQLELINGTYYVMQLTQSVVSAANVEYHARVLIEMAIKRQLIMLASQIHADGYDDSVDCFELLESTEAEFKNIRSWIK